MTYDKLLSLKALLGKLKKLRGDLPPTAPQTAQEGLGKANEAESDPDVAHGQKQTEKPRKPRVTAPGVDAANLDNPPAS